MFTYFKNKERDTMGKTAIVTDSNSGITQAFGEQHGIYVVPMPFYINGELYFEEISLSHAQFYEFMNENAEISTSMPAMTDVLELWDRLLETYDDIVYLPMSSGLSSSCSTATMMAQEYDGRVQVVDNRRISVTQKQAAVDAKALAEAGWDAVQIKEYLEKTALDGSIYIMLDTLHYLKKGGRITPAAAALGTLLRLKPVLQIQGDKLDAYAKCRTVRLGKNTMLDAIRKDMETRFAGDDLHLYIAYTGTNQEEVADWEQEVRNAFPEHTLTFADPLSLSVACHVGPGAIGVGCVKKLPKDLSKC